jgi:hypothetical protein
MPCRIIERPSDALREKHAAAEARQREERKQRMQEAQRLEREAIESRRLASLEHEWSAFKAAANAAIQQQQQMAQQRALDQTMAEIGALIRPPAPLSQR